jgi:hypothetical protein
MLRCNCAQSLRHRLRPRNRKLQSIGAGYTFRPPFCAPPRLSTRTVPQPQAVVALATIKCSKAFDEKSGLAPPGIGCRLVAHSVDDAIATIAVVWALG